MSAPALGARERERLAALLAASLGPQPALRVDRLEPLGAGWETDLFVATVELAAQHGPAQRRLVLRLFHGADHPARARREFELMQRVRQLGVRVPEPLQLVDQDSPLGSSFIVMEHIPGSNLRQRLRGQSDDRILEALDHMAGLLAAIHRLPARQVLPEASPESPAALLPGMRQTVERYALDEFEPILRWLEQRQAPGSAEAPVLLHNDYHPENLLRRDGELVVIDWSFAGVGDYRLDLAWTLLLVGTMLGERYRDPLLSRYAARRGAPVVEFEYFEALKLAARVLTLLTWLHGSVEIPVHRITPEAMRGDYKVHVLNPYRRLKQIAGIELPSLEAL